MPEQEATTKRLNLFERYLTHWVGLRMLAGIALGKGVPGLVNGLRQMELATCDLTMTDIEVAREADKSLQLDFATSLFGGRKAHREFTSRDADKPYPDAVGACVVGS